MELEKEIEKLKARLDNAAIEISRVTKEFGKLSEQNRLLLMAHAKYQGTIDAQNLMNDELFRKMDLIIDAVQRQENRIGRLEDKFD
jgi:hypothetical protein